MTVPGVHTEALGASVVGARVGEVVTGEDGLFGALVPDGDAVGCIDGCMDGCVLGCVLGCKRPVAGWKGVQSMWGNWKNTKYFS